MGIRSNIDLINSNTIAKATKQSAGVAEETLAVLKESVELQKATLVALQALAARA